MHLSGIIPLIERIPALQRLRQELAQPQVRLTLGIDAGRAPALAALIRDLQTPTLIVTGLPSQAETLAEDLAVWLGDEARRIAIYPEHDPPPYERIAPDQESVSGRLDTLTRLQTEPAPVIVTSVKALSQGTIAPDELRSAATQVSAGQRLDMDPFLTRLLALGYSMQPLVEQPGQMARRGGIIDIFPPLSKHPVRIELTGRDVESIRVFDPATQRSLQPIASIAIGPGQELLWGTAAQQQVSGLHGLDFSLCRDEATEAFRRDLETLSGGAGFYGSYFFQPFLIKASLLEHLPASSLLVCEEMQTLAAAAAELRDQSIAARGELEEKGEIPRGLPLPYIEWQLLRETLAAAPRLLELGRWTDEKHPQARRLPFQPAGAFGGQLRRLVTEITTSGNSGLTVIVSQQAPRLSELFAEQGTILTPQQDIAAEPESNLTLVHGSIDGGWRCQDEDINIAILTDREVFGFTKQRRTQPRRGINRQAFLADLSPGDYVVHTEHGIARFAGAVFKHTNGAEREYLELRFAAGDRIFVPSDQLDRISRYTGSSESRPQLTRLGSGDWQRTKQRIRRAMVDLAEELLTLYAAREAAQGQVFSPDTAWQQEMEASFPYVETPDQLAAITEVKRDMESPRPMDRLVCGDVGYGKTEVALRAAFKAVMEGKQVAVLVPTTVLAQQHFNTFSQRLAAFPVRLEMLSRFRSEPEQRRIVAELALGNLDIVVGTHRLLQRDVRFKDLGLIIIDEEQRFGVAHKEGLKKLRTEVDILTLSATPIPRTLYMALGSIRDISTMETPPEERLPIKTYVSQSDDHLVREALARELERGGQVYFVHNHIHNIEIIARKLRELAPEAEVAVAHGQMDERDLEQAMAQFVAGQADILVCTTIIESGLDIPNVNTIIINQADRLGLSQLYQLRGRVGRGAHRAYAYLLYDNHARLTEVAQKRLQTIFEATDLGAGFQIAMRDLEIRGAGNLLGADQSGHMEAVGFDLYCRLLAEAVERLRAYQAGQPPPPPRAEADVTIDLPLNAYIPAAYVTDLNQRLALYQRLSQLRQPERLEETAHEIKDRFGPLPPPVAELMNVVRLRILALRAGVQSIARQDNQITLRLQEGRETPHSAMRRLALRGLKLGHTTIRLEMRAGYWRLLEETLATLASAEEASAGKTATGAGALTTQ